MLLLSPVLTVITLNVTVPAGPWAISLWLLAVTAIVAVIRWALDLFP